MRISLVIIPAILLALIAECMGNATNAPPVLPMVGTDLPLALTNTIPFLMATMDSETGKMILTEPPAWMLAGPKTNAPTVVTIQIDCMDSLSNVVVSGQFKTTRPVAFVKWEVVEE